MHRHCLIAASVLAACTPALDWREVRPPETGAAALFPCKPTQETRQVTMTGIDVRMTLLACEAGGATWALAHADVINPAKVSQALDELADATLRNIAADAAATHAAAVKGMTPNPRARRVLAEGVRPDGARLQGDITVFAKGTRVYQASVLSTTPDEAGANAFVSSVHWP